MNNFILTPVFAFLAYALAVSAVSGLARMFSAKGQKSQFKSEPYASGEDYDPVPAAPGYRQFFVIALFFAVLHLGIIMVGSSDLSSVTVIYLLGLMLALIALILG